MSVNELDHPLIGRMPRRAARLPRAAAPPAVKAPPRRAPKAVRPLLLLAGALAGAAVFLPLWGMTLVSTQYPDGLRMVVYPTRIVGDIREINVLNHYIGMAEITDGFFVELKVLPVLLGLIALGCVAGAVLRRRWAIVAPLAVMVATAAYGFWSMRQRLYQFGHELDPAAPIDIAPFTPPMFGEHQLAQFATWSYFSWGTWLPVLAGALVAAALWLDVRAARAAAPSPA